MSSAAGTFVHEQRTHEKQEEVIEGQARRRYEEERWALAVKREIRGGSGNGGNDEDHQKRRESEANGYEQNRQTD
jgi:hypothetical protein